MDAILALTAGSTSLRFSLYGANGEPTHDSLFSRGKYLNLGTYAEGCAGGDRVRWLGDLDALRPRTHAEAILSLICSIETRFADLDLIAVGHGVTHSGRSFVPPVFVTRTVLKDLRRLIPVAPLHQPHSVAAIHLIALEHPTLPQVACFDTGVTPAQEDFMIARSAYGALRDNDSANFIQRGARELRRRSSGLPNA